MIHKVVRGNINKSSALFRVDGLFWKDFSPTTVRRIKLVTQVK